MCGQATSLTVERYALACKRPQPDFFLFGGRERRNLDHGAKAGFVRKTRLASHDGDATNGTQKLRPCANSRSLSLGRLQVSYFDEQGTSGQDDLPVTQPRDCFQIRGRLWQGLGTQFIQA